MSERRLGYGEAVALSWAVNWRLAIANFVLIILMGGLVWIVRPLAAVGALSAILYFALTLLVAWPLLVRKMLESHGGTLQLLSVSNNHSAETLSISYWKSILLAFVVEGATVVVALLTISVLALAGIRFTSRDMGAFNLLAGLLRLLFVMPIGIKLFAREKQMGYTGTGLTSPL